MEEFTEPRKSCSWR